MTFSAIIISILSILFVIFSIWLIYELKNAPVMPDDYMEEDVYKRKNNE